MVYITQFDINQYSIFRRKHLALYLFVNLFNRTPFQLLWEVFNHATTDARRSFLHKR